MHNSLKTSHQQNKANTLADSVKLIESKQYSNIKTQTAQEIFTSYINTSSTIL